MKLCPIFPFPSSSACLRQPQILTVFPTASVPSHSNLWPLHPLALQCESPPCHSGVAVSPAWSASSPSWASWWPDTTCNGCCWAIFIGLKIHILGMGWVKAQTVQVWVFFSGKTRDLTPVLYLLFLRRAATNSSDKRSELQPLSDACFPLKEVFRLAHSGTNRLLLPVHKSTSTTEAHPQFPSGDDNAVEEVMLPSVKTSVLCIALPKPWVAAGLPASAVTCGALRGLRTADTCNNPSAQFRATWDSGWTASRWNEKPSLGTRIKFHLPSLPLLLNLWTFDFATLII